MKYAPSILLLAITVIIYGVLYNTNRAYLSDYKLSVNPDAVTYVDLGRNIWLKGEYSRSSVAPFKPDFKWNPVYPVLSGAMNILFGSAGIFALNFAFALLSCTIIYRLLDYYAGSFYALTGAMIFALDPLVYSLIFQPMSDIVFISFILAGLYFTLPILFPLEEKTSPLWRLMVGGIAFGMAILTRPTGLYLPLIITLCYLIKLFWQNEKRMQFLQRGAVFFLSAYFLAAVWMVRNYNTFGIFTLSGNENIVMVYYTGGGAWQIQNKCTLDQAQRLIEKEYNLPPVVVCHNSFAYDVSPAEIDTQLKSRKREVLLKYPAALVQSAATGLPKSLLAHETGFFGQICNSPWKTAGLDLKKTPSYFKTLMSNSPTLICVFFWSVAFQITVILLGIFGFIFIWIYNRNLRWLLFVLAGIAAYFILTMGLSGADCCARYRLPVMPVFYIFSAISIEYIINRYCNTKREI